MEQSRRSEIRLIAKDGELIEACFETPSAEELKRSTVTGEISDAPETTSPANIASSLGALLVYAGIALLYVYAIIKLVTTL